MFVPCYFYVRFSSLTVYVTYVTFFPVILQQVRRFVEHVCFCCVLFSESLCYDCFLTVNRLLTCLYICISPCPAFMNVEKNQLFEK